MFKPAALTLFLGCLPLTAVRAVPVISEFMADNASGLTDGAGRHSDWIEIQNPNGATVNLAGWHLTDDAALPTKWTFPAVSLPPGQRLLVFASGDGAPDAGGSFHTNFSLAKSGEYLALVAPDGLTTTSAFAPAYPPQYEDVSYGLTRARTTLLAPGAVGKATVAASGIDNWTDNGYTDAAWTNVINGIGYNFNETAIIPAVNPPCAAYAVPAGTVGNQNYGGPLGMDFSAEKTLTVTALGAFDSGSDGFQSVIRVQLWSRNENNTPDNFADDTGQAILAEVEFSAANPGAADGGSRFITLPAPLTLPVGNYSIVAWGYSSQEPNGNAGGGAAAWTTCDADGSIVFDGGGRYGATGGSFPNGIDGGPPNRYAAGTFKYSAGPPDLRRTAYRVASGQAGNQAYGGPLGMDFVVAKSIKVASLGVLDDLSNGIAAGMTLTAQLWRRNDAGTPGTPADDTGLTIVATQTFTTAAPGTLEGGSRFKTLSTPLELSPGAYTMVAYGYGATERNGNATAAPWSMDRGGQGSIQFVGSSRYGFTAGAFPHVADSSPANRYAAGTFQYFENGDPMVNTDVAAQMRNIASGMYLRLPFSVPDPSIYGSLELEMATDDGYAAWVNGTAAASRNAPSPLLWNSTATQSGALLQSLPLPSGMLVPGGNILAMHGLNVSASDNDFLLRVRLTGISAAATAQYFPSPTPGSAEGTGVSGLLEPVSFDVNHGYFDEPFTVTLSTTSVGADIRYTTDGSAPVETSPLYTGPLLVSTTTVLRAASFRTGFAASDSNTRSYLFLDSVVAQNNTPAGYPTSWNAIAADYAMEDNATDLATLLGEAAGTPLPTLRQKVKQALLALPAISIVTDKSHLFDSGTGIYPNPSGRGDLWEKPCSAELIPQPGNPEAGFQINGGIQVMGLTSRNLNVNARLPLRVIFSRRYGPASLEYPLYPGNPVTRYDSIALRNNTRDNWGYAPNGAIYIRDQWCKEALAAMNKPSSSGRYVHLFLNGIYWGIYNPTERPDGDFCQEHFGGQADEWDSVTLCCPNRAKSGTLTKWQELMARCTQGFETDAKYEFVQGNFPNGQRNPATEILLDVDSLIHFALSGYYHASGDWPGNFYTVRRQGPESRGFQFITWDSDLGFSGNNVNADKTQNDNGSWWSNSPGQIDLALRAHPEYRLRFADVAHRHLFNGGSLTPAVSAARFLDIATRIEPALGAEGARWGDAKGLATLANWRQQRDFFTTSYFPNRTTVVINQLKARGLYPNVAAPSYNQNGGQANAGFSLTMTGTGTVYYTLDGTDPRLRGGAVAGGAQSYTTAVPLTASTVVKSRSLSGSVWSALAEAAFQISPPASAANLVISEIHYNPAGPDDTEFIELLNVSSSTIDLSGVRFSGGVIFTFPTGTTLAAGARTLVVKNVNAMALTYGPGLVMAGEFQETTSLDNSGEELTLFADDNSVIAQFRYHDDAPWPNEADGGSYTLTLVHPAAAPDYDSPLTWRASGPTGGTPGGTDAISFTGNPSADNDHDGISAAMEFALGTSDADGTDGPQAISFDPTDGSLRLRRRLTGEAVIVLQTSTDLSSWQSAQAQWKLKARIRLSADAEELRFEPDALNPPPSRSFLRAVLP